MIANVKDFRSEKARILASDMTSSLGVSVTQVVQRGRCYRFDDSAAPNLSKLYTWGGRKESVLSLRGGGGILAVGRKDAPCRQVERRHGARAFGAGDGEAAAMQLRESFR
jgi:hypothetical protein